MLGANDCAHGVPHARKVCCFPECEYSAFVSISCDDCQTEHEHDGQLQLQTRATLLAQLKQLPVGCSHDDAAVENVCDMAGDAALHINELCKDIIRDFEGVCAELTLKPEFETTIWRLQRCDYRLTGAQVFALTEAIRNKDCYSNKSCVNKKASELDKLYSSFIENLSSSITRFQQAKEALLTGKELKEPSITEWVEIRKQSETKTVSGGAQKILVYNQQPAKQAVKPVRPTYCRKLDFTKIADIAAWDDKLNLHVQVVRTDYVKKGMKTYVKCLLGDETGIVEGRFDSEQQPEVKTGATLYMTDVKAHVYLGYIVIHVKHPDSIHVSPEEIEQVKMDVNISKEYYEEGDPNA